MDIRTLEVPGTEPRDAERQQRIRALVALGLTRYIAARGDVDLSRDIRMYSTVKREAQEATR